MDKKLEDILNEALAPELKAQLQEAFDAKVDAMRAEVQESVEADLANRYEHDKAQLVEAMDEMLKSVVRVHEEAKAAEITKLKEAREAVAESNKSTKAALRARIAEMAERSGKVINESLSKEIEALRSEKDAAVAAAEQLAENVSNVKAKLAENHKAHLEKINDFVTRSITRELSEFESDKRELVETRVRLVAESKQKIAEMQGKFISESAKKVEKMVNESLKREMAQLHEDLEAHRQNMFGRRIFEAVAAEFQASYLAEGTEMRKLEKMLESKEAEMAAVVAESEARKAELAEAAQEKAAAERKVQLAEARAERTRIMSELMSNLKGEKRSVMESMLESTKTSALRAAFEKLLPVVLSENARKVAPTGKKEVLSENAGKTTISTGDRKSRKVEADSVEETQKMDEIATIVQLAGIRK